MSDRQRPKIQTEVWIGDIRMIDPAFDEISDEEFDVLIDRDNKPQLEDWDARCGR